MAEDRNIPLVVDLDGTLIRSDMMWESLARLLRRNPFAIFQILFWWARGRALLKQKLAARVAVDPASLDLNEEFVAWLRLEKKSDRKIILATASDLKMAQPVAERVGLFDEVLASDGRTNLRSENKLRALTEKFGPRGFDYAGNSSADFAVWRGSRQAIVVNASPFVQREAANCTALGPTFCANFSHFTVAKSVATELLWRSGYALAALAGLLLALAFPKFSLAGLAWLAPALLVYATNGKSGADAFRTSYVSGLTFWLASLYWLLLIPVAGFPILGWLALSFYVALFTGVWTWLIAPRVAVEEMSWSRRTLWALAGAVIWVALEMIRVRLLGGFPWSLLGVSQYQMVPLIQIAAFTGVYGVSFLIVWLSLSLFCAVRMIFHRPEQHHIWQREIILPLFFAVTVFAAGWMHILRTPPPPPGLRVTMIQPNIPQTVIWNPDADTNSFARFLAQNEAALTNATDLLLWPESAVPELSLENGQAISDLARRHHLWLILNSTDIGQKNGERVFYNAAFLINPQGDLVNVYHKQKLVIFGEYIPLVRWLPFLKWFTPITGGWTAGERSVTFTLARTNLPVVRCASLICFEDTFATTTRAAAQDDIDFLVNLTNDGWFGESAEQWQHMAQSVFRCVENGLPLLRCANNGVTCVIDTHGRVESILRDAQGSEYRAGALTVDVPLAIREAPRTFYRRHGDWFGLGCVLLALSTIVKKILEQLREKFSGIGFSAPKWKR